MASRLEQINNLLRERSQGRFTEAAGPVADISSSIQDRQQFQQISGRGNDQVRDDTTIGTVIPREAWVMTTQKRILENDSDVLAFRCNPKDAAWRMPQRSVEQQTRLGTVLHVWKDNPRGTFFDEPEVSFTFQAGNIIPISSPTFAQEATNVSNQLDGDSPRVPPGLGFATPQPAPGLHNFYRFLDIVDEPKTILAENGFGQTNFVYLFYHSRILPAITLVGLFKPEGISWTDNAEDPAKLEWQATFKVYDSFPRMKSQELIQTYRSVSVFDRGSR